MLSQNRARRKEDVGLGTAACKGSDNVFLTVLQLGTKDVPDPQRFGVPVFEGGRIVRIAEKPKRPASPHAVVGIYFYDHTVFDRIRRLKPSARDEYEITDVNNSYLADGQLDYGFLEGWWTDAGTFESL